MKNKLFLISLCIFSTAYTADKESLLEPSENIKRQTSTIRTVLNNFGFKPQTTYLLPGQKFAIFTKRTSPRGPQYLICRSQQAPDSIGEPYTTLSEILEEFMYRGDEDRREHFLLNVERKGTHDQRFLDCLYSESFDIFNQESQQYAENNNVVIIDHNKWKFCCIS